MATNEDPWKVKIPVKTRPQYDQLMGEPKIDTLSRKLIIGVAPAGIFLDKDAFPAVPSNPKEIIAAAKECYEAGAALIHIHCKNEDGFGSVDPGLTVYTLNAIREVCPGVIISGNVAHVREAPGRKLFEDPMNEILKLDPSVFDTYTVQTATRMRYSVTKDGLRDQIAYLEDHGIKPEIQCPTFHGMVQLKEWLLDDNFLRMPPPFLNVHLGKVESVPIAVGEPLATRLLLDSLDLLPNEGVRGVFACGRNWLPITATALTQGVDFVRVGHDDIVYMYPHKDEIAQTSADMVRKVMRLAGELGIDVADAAESRKILGMPAMQGAKTFSETA